MINTQFLLHTYIMDDSVPVICTQKKVAEIGPILPWCRSSFSLEWSLSLFSNDPFG